MVDFAKLKKNRSTDQLKKAIENTQGNSEAGSKGDDRFWQPTADKAGNGMAIIRFLPAPAVDGDDALPWVRIFHHGFQGPGGWLIDNCLTTLNDKCPVCEHNSVLWNSGVEANKEIVRKQKRKLNYITNILVISDPSNPENEGQVRLYKFGKKIFDKINEAMNPEFADETSVNPFDLWDGANFKVKIRQVEGYRNYDKSEFSEPTALLDGDDAKLEALWKSEYSLKEFTDKTNFKDYDQLKQRLDKALGLSGAVNLRTKAEDVEVSSFKEDDLEVLNTNSSVSEDEDLDYFKSLADTD
jgi:hypothetical protein